MKEWLKDTGYWVGRAAQKVLLLATYVFTVAAFIALGACAFVGAVAISDGYWNFGWR